MKTLESQIETVVKMVAENDLSMLSATTGSGKSLSVPLALAFQTQGRVFVAVPKRNVADSLAKTQKERIVKLGKDNAFLSTMDVGVGMEGKHDYTEKTNIVYATTGHISGIFQKELFRGTQGTTVNDINFCDILIIDEAHEKTVEMITLLTLWDIARKSEAKHPRLLISTATPINISISPPPSSEFNFEYTPFEVKIEYLPQGKNYDEEEEKKRRFMTTEERRFSRGEAVTKFTNMSCYGYAAQKARDLHDEGAALGQFSRRMLIFVPGKSEMYFIKKMLIDFYKIQNAKIAVRHSSASDDELKEYVDMVEKGLYPGMRHIIIATNSVEAGLTIDDLYYIIDTMTEKVSYETDEGGKMLKTQFISQLSAKQRKGRVGRTQEGTVYRMITEGFFDKLKLSRNSEMERVNISGTVLDLHASGIDSRKIIEVNQSKVLGSLTYLFNHDYITDKSITEKGKFSRGFPISIKNSGAIFDYIDRYYENNFFGFIVVIAIIETYDRGYFLGGDAFEEGSIKREKLEFFKEKFKGKDDIDTALIIFDTLITGVGTKFFLPETKDQVTTWAKNNMLDVKKIDETTKKIYTIVKTLFTLKEGPETEKHAQIVAKSGKPFTSRVVSLDREEIMRNSFLILGKYYPERIIEYNSEKKKFMNKEGDIFEFQQEPNKKATILALQTFYNRVSIYLSVTK